jgi:hypothetical protein
MSDTYTVRLEPIGVEFDVEDGETVLDAAFRQGISLVARKANARPANATWSRAKLIF